MRKSKQRDDEAYFARVHGSDLCLCPLCGRNIPDSQKDEHHLVPRSKNGTETTTLHRACHRQIHMLFTLSELAELYNSAEALLEHSEMQKFVQWISTKPDDFMPQFRSSERKKNAWMIAH